mgnify:CR=1 FL=1
MIESPLIQELMDETDLNTTRRAILRVLSGRFGQVSESLRESLENIPALDILNDLIVTVATCQRQDEFETTSPKE